MNFTELAVELDALEAVDASDFQRRARLLQSMWRVEQNFGFPCVEEEVTTKVGTSHATTVISRDRGRRVGAGSSAAEARTVVSMIDREFGTTGKVYAGKYN